MSVHLQTKWLWVRVQLQSLYNLLPRVSPRCFEFKWTWLLSYCKRVGNVWFFYLLQRVNSLNFLNFSCSQSVHLAYNGIERNVIKEKITRKKKRQLGNLLTHFMPLTSFYTPWKHQETCGFLTFSGDIKRSVA